MEDITDAIKALSSTRTHYCRDDPALFFAQLESEISGREPRRWTYPLGFPGWPPGRIL